MHEFKFDLPKEEILTVPATFCEDDAGFSANFESGLDGASAYEIALRHGFAGTEQQWLESLKGEPGADGFSPSVAVSDIDGGHRVTITDKSGPKSFDVLADIEYIVNAVLAALGGQPDVPTVNNTPVVGMAVVGLAVVG